MRPHVYNQRVQRVIDSLDTSGQRGCLDSEDIGDLDIRIGLFDDLAMLYASGLTPEEAVGWMLGQFLAGRWVS